MALPPFLITQQGHLAMFVVDPERDLVRFCCRFCGGTTEEIETDSEGNLHTAFRSLPHEPTCLVITTAMCLDEHERRVA